MRSRRDSKVAPHVAQQMGMEDLRKIANGTSDATGERLFDELVRHLSSVIGTKYAWITEWHREKRELEAISFWDKGHFVKDFSYDIAGTPCEIVIGENRPFHIPDRVTELFPNDEILKELNAVSYMAVPLVDTDASVLGHLAVLDDEPMPQNELASTVLSIFAGRASAELRRLRRERALRERENKLSRLFEGAMDSIVEFDPDLRVTNLNAAAKKEFGRSLDAELFLDHIFTADSIQVLERLRDGLNNSTSERSVWVKDRLYGRYASGEQFQTEATLSMYETEGQAYYALILRNITEQLMAEEKMRSLSGEAEYLRNEIERLSGFDEIIGSSSELKRVLADVSAVADGDTTVLITGETGTGKELIARAIHRLSGRSAKPMITVNCAAVAANLQESEFFGHEKGAFTGAIQRRDGRFKLADGGTIFLDEVGEMPLDLQAKLLRVLQEGEFEPVGGSRTVKVNVRVIAATNRDLLEMTRNGSFRSDLWYRLNVFPLNIPPLRERREDIIPLAQMFAKRLAEKRSRPLATFDPSAERRLTNYDWPGNVRELQNVVERAFITSVDGMTLNFDRAIPDDAVHQNSGPDLQIENVDERVLRSDQLKELERRNIEMALARANGRISGAAQLLGIHANTLASRLKKLGISPKRS